MLTHIKQNARGQEGHSSKNCLGCLCLLAYQHAKPFRQWDIHSSANDVSKQKERSVYAKTKAGVAGPGLGGKNSTPGTSAPSLHAAGNKRGEERQGMESELKQVEFVACGVICSLDYYPNEDLPWR